jgi:lipopolysaccharide/colanic/teichoic acid biosynthesis glycosyltransferase
VSSAIKSTIPRWKRFVKRTIDVIVSFTGLIILSPLMAFIAMRVKFSSRGPVLYSQERIGYSRKIFRIRKFRSMYENAEVNGPALSQKNDIRITSWGRSMRKWKLDELPQLWNVLAGQMSLVGPRPERAYYIALLAEKGISFDELLAVKPGITSLGMVQFGYASNINDIIQRMKFDLIYLQNFSLMLDVKIMFRTLRIIFKAKGR